MEWIHQLMAQLDVAALLQSLGPWVLFGIGIIVFIESGVLFPFLPGDSLLVTAAALRHELNLSVWSLLIVAILAAIAGDQIGFWLGHRFGRGLFKEDAKVLSMKHLHRTEAFFHKWGPLALVLGRFVPIVRTFVPVSAGTANMHYKKFVGWNISGAIIWVFLMTAVGVVLGNIPGVTKSIEGIMLLIVFISVLPIIFAAWRKRVENKRIERESDHPCEAR